MERTTLLRPSRASARRCLWGAAMALGCATARAENVDPNAIAVAFSGGDTSGQAGVVNKVVLNVEVTDDQVAESRDFRSMSLIVDIDCRGDRERLRRAEAFDQPNLAGTAQPRAVSGEWAVPEAYMGEVIRTICTTHGMRFVEQVASAGGSPAVARVQAPPAEAPKPTPPAAPAPTPPQPAPPPEPAIGSATSRALGPYPVPDAAPVALATASPNRWSSPGAEAGLLSQARVQIASSPSRAEAEAMLDRSAALISPPLKGAVQVATVHGKTVYRSIIAPFGSESEARAFCARTGLTLDGCFVWRAR
jgi:hypothetical protein